MSMRSYFFPVAVSFVLGGVIGSNSHFPAQAADAVRRSASNRKPVVRTRGQAQPGPAQDSVAIEQAKIAEAFCAEPQLHGAWIDRFSYVDPADRTRFQVRAFVAQDRAESQLAAIREMLQRVGRNHHYRIGEVVAWPISQLVNDVNATLESDRAYDGCQIMGAYVGHEEKSEKGYLRLMGRVVNATAKQAIQNTLDRYCRDHPIFSAHGDDVGYTVASRTLSVEPLDWARGQAYFVDGLDYFWKGRYRDAETAFRQATVDAPRLLEYRYWRVVSLLRHGRYPEASAVMSAVTNRERGRLPSVSDNERLLRSLERIQGTERRGLIDLERQARVAFYTRVLQPACAPADAAGKTAQRMSNGR